MIDYTKVTVGSEVRHSSGERGVTLKPDERQRTNANGCKWVSECVVEHSGSYYINAQLKGGRVLWHDAPTLEIIVDNLFSEASNG